METEEEQVEKLKSWLKENGLSIVFGIIIGVGGIGGYNYWTRMQETAAAEASSHFNRMMDALASGDGQALRSEADTLLRDHAGSDYALLAHLALANLYVGNGEFDQAEVELRQAVGSAGEKPLAYVARTRLAAVQIQNGQFEQALATLDVEFPAEFSARVEELRGDAYALQGKIAEAIQAYRDAQSSLPGPANETFLRQKLDDLGAAD